MKYMFAANIWQLVYTFGNRCEIWPAKMTLVFS